MLYDKRWDKQTKADPLTLASLIAWLETQPAAKTYCYYCFDGTCLLDCYLSSVTGEPSAPSPETHWTTCGGGDNYVFIARSRPWTFGAALERARALTKG